MAPRRATIVSGGSTGALPEQIQTILDNLRGFGPRRLALMGAIAAIVMAVIGAASYYLNKPAYEPLYVGLERSDVNQIGLVLGENGIPFNVDAKGTTVLVPTGTAAQARMLLAEKGLPTSANSGYELFDHVGSLGLTSFMQKITEVRALEGEIARTIETIRGIRAARVHIVMPQQGDFRREQTPPSASVVIRTDDVDAVKQAMAIRYMVAAAVPGLTPDKVTIMDTAGNLLAAGDDPKDSSASRAIGIQRTVETQVEQNIRRALAPYLGADNFRASVHATVDTDARKIDAIVYDPKSQVERSVQTVSTNEDSKQQSATASTSVDQSIPTEQQPASEGPKSSSASKRKEETTNYEINSTHTVTTSNGYAITRLSIAVVVNRQRLLDVLGAKATPEQIQDRVAQIQKVAASAAGFDKQRGDKMDVAVVEFLDDKALEPPPAPTIMERISAHAGTLINAGAFILVSLLVVWFGLRPMTAALTRPPASAKKSFEEVQASLAAPEQQLIGSAHDPAEAGHSGDGAKINPIDELRQKLRPAPQERLARMVDLDEERTAQILRKWVRQEAG